MTRAILLLSLVVISLMVTNVIGHTVLVSVDGSRSCVRMAPSNSPITDLGSNNMRCYGKNSPAGSHCSVRAGSTVTLKWQHEANGAANDIIAQSHYGPVSVYLAHAESAGNGAAWFKVYEDGHSGGKWATDRLIANNGNVRFTIPANLKSGNYIVRSEIIALHEGFKDNGAQFYAGCADLTVTGGGSGDCGPKVSIPGNWIASNQDPGVKINIYNGVNNYPIPGPNIATCNGNGGNGGGAPAPAPTPRPAGNNNGGGGSGSASGLQNGKVYYLKPLSNQGLCLDASGSNDGAAVLVYNCQNSNNQKWKLINAGNGWELQEQRSGKALDGWASGEGIQLWSYGGGSNQKWSVSGNSAGYVFKNVQSGQVLTAQGNNSGAKAHQANSNNGNNQKWKLVAA